jgi:hypothetical protein
MVVVCLDGQIRVIGRYIELKLNHVIDPAGGGGWGLKVEGGGESDSPPPPPASRLVFFSLIIFLLTLVSGIVVPAKTSTLDMNRSILGPM